MLISLGIAMLKNLIPGTLMFLGSAAVTLWFYRELTSTCAINESECLGGQASIFVFGMLWLFAIAAAAWFVWQRTNASHLERERSKGV
jgi:hypothetical protein